MTEMTLEQWNAVINVDLTGPFICSKAVIPSMIKRGGGKISVSGREEDGNLIFTVKDTGSGMSKEQLDDLNERMKKGQPTVSEGGGGGFGLVNVNMRIRLYYNLPDGLKIKSNSEGTEVSFMVPCRTKEEIFEDESVSG